MFDVRPRNPRVKNTTEHFDSIPHPAEHPYAHRLNFDFQHLFGMHLFDIVERAVADADTRDSAFVIADIGCTASTTAQDMAGYLGKHHLQRSIRPLSILHRQDSERGTHADSMVPQKWMHDDLNQALAEIPDNSVDFAFSAQGLTPVVDSLKALSHIYRILVPGGRACLQVHEGNLAFGHNVGVSFSDIMYHTPGARDIFRYYSSHVDPDHHGLLVCRKPTAERSHTFSGFPYTVERALRLPHAEDGAITWRHTAVYRKAGVPVSTELAERLDHPELRQYFI